MPDPRPVPLVAGTLTAGLRASDRPARYGGDEFLILLPDTDLSGAARVAERLRAALAERPIVPLDRPVTASFGLARLEPADEPLTLRDRADAALIAAKRAGGNRVETA